MRTLIVYESYFGCTREIAEAVAREFRAGWAQPPPDPGGIRPPLSVKAYDLVVVGGPTQARAPEPVRHPPGGASAGRRCGAARRGSTLESASGLREWLDGLGLCEGTAAAAFDTRLHAPALPTGRASRALASGLRRHGFRLVGNPMSFLVGPNDTLLPEEEARATAWAGSLLQSCSPNRRDA